MANSWGLNEDWDMYMDSNNNLARVVAEEEVRQHIRERLQFFFGEWFLNREAGVPWYQKIFVKPANLGLSNGYVKKEIIETPGVNELLAYEANFDYSRREYEIPSFTVSTDYGLLTETL